MGSAMKASLRRLLADRTPPQTMLVAIGTTLMAVGLGHLVVFAIDGGAWAGPISWRKPTTFGLSFGATALAVGFVANHLRLGRRSEWVLLGGFGLASALEVAWVTVQRWRGVPAHFARTGIDAVLFGLAGVTIGVVGITLVVLTIAAFRRLEAAPSMALAIRVGLVLLLVGQALGGAIIANGTALDVEPTETDLAIFGAAGETKVPHAVALHAIQVLPVLAWLASFTARDERRRRALVAGGAAGYTSLVAANVVQTSAGLAPFDLSWPGALLTIVGAAALSRAFVIVGLDLRRHPATAVPPTTAPDPTRGDRVPTAAGGADR